MEENKELQNKNLASDNQAEEKVNAQTEPTQQSEEQNKEVKAEVTDASTDQETNDVPQSEKENDLSDTPKDDKENAEDSVAEGDSIEDDDIYGDKHATNHEEDDDEHEEEVTEEMFQEMSREELLEELKETVKVDNVNKYKTKVSFIRLAFLQKTKEKKQEDYEKFVEKGGENESFIEEKDEIEKRFNDVMSVFRQKRSEYNRQQEQQKLLNLEKKNVILEKLRDLINSEEPLKETYDQFKVLQEEWKGSGMVPRGELVELWKNYHFLVEKFFDKVKINKELRDLGLRKNLKQKVELCEKAEDLIVETNVLKSFKLLQKYHEKWREIGPVPHEHNEEIWQRFKAATDKINERRREYYNERDEIFEENYKIKEALCEEAQTIIDELNQKENAKIKDWLETSDKVNNIFERWRKTGRARREKNDEIWSKFKGIIDIFFKQKKEFFKQMKSEQKDNYDKKLELVLRAETIKDNEDWKETKNELISLQKQWKEIGYVPKKHSDKLWKRFRGACDHFFNRRDEFFKDVREEEKENLAKKHALIEQAKAFELSDNRSEDIEKLKAFQREWIAIGFVPIKEKDRVNKTFKEIIDKHFENLNISAFEQKAMRYKNRIENLKDSPNVGNKINRERNFLLGKMKEIEDNIQLWENNIGFFSQSKKSEQLKVEFQKKIDRAKQELALFKSKIRLLDSAEREQNEDNSDKA